MKKTVFLLLTFLLAGSINHTFASEEAETPFDKLMERLGLADNTIDYSDVKKIAIDKPTCAYLNVTGIDKMPESKTEYHNVYLDIYTTDGNHFKKRAIISAQGNSSLAFPKKNFKADFCEDEWLGEETTSLTIGEWVKQDAFHFNAYYVDYLRGIGVVCYQLYDQIAQNSGRPWTRALDNIAKPKDNARCYPDGFPCIVYLNGNFYGIFAWQLKKHRDNMNMKKAEATHIHLDGKIGNDTFWGLDNPSWDQFEVRNPKSLYTMNGQQYDGDHPQELIDETSKSFQVETDDSATTADKQRTALVKKSVKALAGYYAQVESMRKARKSTAEIRWYIEEHFDITSMIDYACFHFAVNNYDGFRNNWQWFTYDGRKWFVTPYDLDNTFGNWYSGITPPERTWMGGGDPWELFAMWGPFYWLPTYYSGELRRRYIALRNAGIIDADNIIGLLQKWHSSVSDCFTDEWRRWPDSRCISETVASRGWALCDEGYDKPQWNSSTAYRRGDRCTLDGLAWEATMTVRGVRPYVKLGYQDSLERYQQWITQRIKLLDAHFGYNPAASQRIDSPTDGSRATTNGPFTVHSLAGHQLHSPVPGVNIYRYSDGSVRKVQLRK